MVRRRAELVMLLAPHTHLRCKLRILGVAVLGIAVFVLGGTASAAPEPVGLGDATDAAVVAGASPTNADVSNITGDVSSINPSQPGFVPCPGGADCVNYVDGGQQQNTGPAQADAAAALAAWVHTSSLGGAIGIGPQLGNLSLVAGLYSVGAANITGVLTLDAANDPLSVWIFQASHIQTATGSNVVFINTAGTSVAQLVCNVFWTTDSADLLGTTFVGTILANTSITVGRGVRVDGRLFANNGNVTLIEDTIVRPTGCAVLPAGTGGGPRLPAGTGGGPRATPAVPVGASPALTGLTG